MSSTSVSTTPSPGRLRDSRRAWTVERVRNTSPGRAGAWLTISSKPSELTAAVGSPFTATALAMAKRCTLEATRPPNGDAAAADRIGVERLRVPAATHLDDLLLGDQVGRRPLGRGADGQVLVVPHVTLPVPSGMGLGRPNPATEPKGVRYEVAGRVGVITLNRPRRLNAWTGPDAQRVPLVPGAGRRRPGVRVSSSPVPDAGSARVPSAGPSRGTRERVATTPACAARTWPQPGLRRRAPTSTPPSPTTSASPGDRRHQRPYRRCRPRPRLLLRPPFRCRRGQAHRRPMASSACPPSTASPACCPRLIGLTRANDILLSSRVVLAEEAAAMGLVNRVLPPRGSPSPPPTTTQRALARQISPPPLRADQAPDLHRPPPRRRLRRRRVRAPPRRDGARAPTSPKASPPSRRSAHRGFDAGTPLEEMAPGIRGPFPPTTTRPRRPASRPDAPIPAVGSPRPHGSPEWAAQRSAGRPSMVATT